MNDTNVAQLTIADNQPTAQPTDNLEAFEKEVGQWIVANAPDSLSKYERKAIAAGSSFSGLDFRAADPSESPSVTVYAQFQYSHRELESDAKGNQFARVKFHVEVNWSTCGSLAPSLARKHAQFVLDVIAFADQLVMTFEHRPVHIMYRTVEQAAANLAAEHLHVVRIACEAGDTLKGMRVGNVRYASFSADRANVPNKVYEFSSNGDKRYVATVTNEMIEIKRVD